MTIIFLLWWWFATVLFVNPPPYLVLEFAIVATLITVDIYKFSVWQSKRRW